jgi:hypothetical protein
MGTARLKQDGFAFMVLNATPLSQPDSSVKQIFFEVSYVYAV